MNVVRSAGGGSGGGRKNSYKQNQENPAVFQPTIRPTHSLAELICKTRFSKEEIRHLYRRFKQDSPSGEVTKSRFATIFGTLFPGGECFRYSSFIFQNIDRANSGSIKFEDFLFTLSVLIHGTIEDRLSWTFDLYDLDKDGKLTKTELLQLVTSVFQMIIPPRKVKTTWINDDAIEDRTDELFQEWDKSGQGFVYKNDFVQYCSQNETIKQSMELLTLNIAL